MSLSGPVACVGKAVVQALRAMQQRPYIHPLTIGSVPLENNLLLAPMAGFTNLAFRLIAKELGGCGMVASEMVAALAPAHRAQVRRFSEITRTVPEEGPVQMQVYGREPAWCAATARDLQEAGAAIVDLNCGCPVRKAKQAGCGVALMREPAQVARIIAAMVDAVTVPVTVKIRLGTDAAHRTAEEVALAAVAAGACAVTVHARTGESKHGEPLDLAALAAVVRRLDAQVPVIANGDLHSAAAIRQVADATGVDGYMIGRAACGDPWLFRNLIAELTGSPPYRPSLTERRAALERHFRLVMELFGEERGCRVMRKYTLFYCQGLPGVRRFRDQFMRVASVAQFHDLVAAFFAGQENG